MLVYSVVPMFFALSGFLVTGSAMRLPTTQFAASRALRIVPALLVDTAVSVFLFGVLLTTLPTGQFLTNPATLKYWLNTVGEIHYYLPGVFETNPLHTVNGSLWTIRPELGCYVAMTALIATGLIRRWPVVLLAAVVLWCASFASQHVGPHFPGKYQLTTDFSKLVIFFLAGALVYLLRYKIPVSPVLAAGAVVFVLGGMTFGVGRDLWNNRIFLLASCPVLTYLVIWLGMQKFPKLPVYSRGDYSYGIYLYGFPIEQVIRHVTGSDQPLVIFVLTIVPVTLLAMLSWHFVEKPTLKLRKYLRRGQTVSAVHEAQPTTAAPQSLASQSSGA